MYATSNHKKTSVIPMHATICQLGISGKQGHLYIFLVCKQTKNFDVTVKNYTYQIDPV